MSFSQTNIEGAPFRPFEDQYLITSFQDTRPSDDLRSLFDSARARLGKRSRRAAAAAAESHRSARS